MSSRFLFAVVLVLVCSSSAFSQKPTGGVGNTGGSTGGNQPGFNNVPNMSNPSQGADIQVRIAWQNERTVDDEAIHVQLLNSGNVPIMDTFSNRDGMVSFRAVQPGSYRLKLDGSAIQDTTTDAFVVQNQERMHMEWVHVMPKENTHNNGVGPGGPMVSASELNVPPKAKSELDKGMEAYAKGDMKKATEKLHKALEIYPKYARAWNNIGVIQMKEGDKPGAKEAWQKAVDADSRFSAAYLNLARLSLIDKNNGEAQAYVNKAFSSDPNNVEALALMAKAQLLAGQYDKALVNARRAHGLPHEHMADVHLIAGEALLHQGHDGDAIKEYELYLKEYPDSPSASKVRTAMAQIQAKQQQN